MKVKVDKNGIPLPDTARGYLAICEAAGELRRESTSNGACCRERTGSIGGNFMDIVLRNNIGPAYTDLLLHLKSIGEAFHLTAKELYTILRWATTYYELQAAEEEDEIKST